jgi:hypothetical protein
MNRLLHCRCRILGGETIGGKQSYEMDAERTPGMLQLVLGVRCILSLDLLRGGCLLNVVGEAFEFATLCAERGRVV